MDGAAFGSPASRVFSCTGPALIEFGTYEDVTDQFFNGKLDDIRIYNRALTAAEVKQLYQLGTVIIRQ